MVTAKQMSDIREEFERVMTSPQLVVGRNPDKVFVDEMSEFATPMHDDLVDAMNYAFKPPPKLFPKAWIDGVPVMYDPAVTEWPRHGFRWVEGEVQLLHKAFISGTPVENIAAVHKRSVSAVLAQLQSQRLIHHVEGQQVGDWHKRFVTSRRTKILRAGASNPQSKEKVMAADVKAVESKVFIFGNESKDVSDETIFNLIAKREGEIKALEAIKNKPKKLVAQIEQYQKDIDALVKVCDERA